MSLTTLARIAAVALLFTSVACSKREATAAAPKPEAANATRTPPQQAVRSACAMVTASEMSEIVGTAVNAEAESGGGTTTCSYRPPDSSFPYIQIHVEWGGGDPALVAAGILGRLEPGISDPLAGLGDQASAMGPAYMVRTGDDVVQLTLFGLDDRLAAAKRIIDRMRPRMGPSAQARATNAGASGDDQRPAGDGASADAAKVGQLVSGLLSGLAAQNDRSKTSGAADAGGSSTAPETSPPVDQAEYGPATGPSIRIPLVAGLTLVAAEHEPGRGDYEPIVTVANVTNEMVSTTMAANVPEGGRLSVDRNVRREDLRQGRGFRSWYQTQDPPVFAGTTSFSLSAAVLNDLKAKGQADVVRRHPDDSPLAAFASAVAGTANVAEQPGTLKRIESHAVAFPVLVNDAAVELPAIHARGIFDNRTIDFHVLDDPDNPLLLRVAAAGSGRIVRIAFPTPAAAPIEEKLKKDARVELHGIYFDFGKATLRPESEPVLKEIAAALTHNPEWKINIEGHTDNVGGDALNLDLSRRRSEAVKQALIDRYRVPAATLTPAGFGASRPKATNDTLSGRARNRRVELVRQ